MSHMRRKPRPRDDDRRHHRVNLIQLADMCVGAIARSYKADRNNASRWYDMIGPKLTNVWMFR